jgi:outer membrane protein insertion porin family
MKRIVLLLLLAALCASPALAMKVDRVEVEGNYHVSEQKILSIFGILPGEEFSPERISTAIKRLFRTKNFDYIEVSYRREAAKAVVMLKVREYPRVKLVRISGNKHIKTEDIQAKLKTSIGLFARPALITQDVAVIKDLYGEKGYNKAQVEVKKTPLPEEHRAIVAFDITEGEKVQIRHIDFIGNGAIDSKSLRNSMESQEDRWWRGGELKPNVLETDLATIKTMYENEGYLDATVEVYRQIEVNDGKHVDLILQVEEGPQFYLGDLTWSGNTIVTDDEIAMLVSVREGDPYSTEDIELMQINTINGLFWERGYIWSRINPRRRIKGNRVDLDLEIIENNPASIREITITGNTKTFESVIRRELTVYPGDRFMLGDVQRSIRDIFLLGFFAGPPRVDPKRINEEGDIDLMIEVEEKQTGNFKFGAGFSQLNSLSGFLGIQEPNFLGRGKTVALDWEFGRYRTNLNLRYSEPHLLGTDLTFSVSLFNWIQDRVQQQFYTDRRRGFSLQFGHPFPYLDYTRIYLNYRLESVELTNFSPLYPPDGSLRLTDWPLNKSSATVSFVRNSTDSPFHPTRGSISNLSMEFAGGFLGGNVEFFRIMAGSSWFRNIFWKLTFHLSGEAGLLTTYRDILQVSDFEKFRLGGNRQYALRGYDFYEVVPQGNRIYDGGRFFLIFTQEILVPITNAVHALAFYDAGNTWNSFGEADLFRLRRGLGFGVRIEMPGLGTIGFDYGYGFDKYPEPGWEPHFTFGTFF